jgi:hypothetical protein
MANYTKTDLAYRVLRDLNVIDAVETPQAADMEHVKETIDSEMGKLEALGLKMWSTSNESIHPSYFTALSKYMALSVGPHFGIFTVADAERAQRGAENELWRLSAPTLTPTAPRFEIAARGYSRR